MNQVDVLSTGGVVIRELPAERSATEVFEVLRRRPYPFLLESALVGPRLGRYTFLGASPFLTFWSKGRRIWVEEQGQRRTRSGNPFSFLREQLSRYRLGPLESPVPFTGGAVGYLAYDLCHFVEKLPRTAVDDIGFPEMYFSFYDMVIALDHLEERCYVIGADLEPGAPGAHETIRHRIDRLAGEVLQAPILPKDDSPATEGGRAQVRGNFARDDYLAAVHRAKEYIAAGDIFQVNLSQRFEADLGIDAYELYRRLREINPAPFACFLSLGDNAVVSSSPERFLKVTGRHVETRPIKGTRPRGSDEERNIRMRQELLASEKDGAELAMIVDLERNDIGRVCEYGTVRVTEKKVLEEYASVYHLVATVEGDLCARYDLVDLLKATFPGGSITGAPKIRAMEIIDELEPTGRSVYTGSIGYLGFDGTVDLNIAIRTFLVRGRRAFFQVGGGIVADSGPVAEYDETLDKARALFQALGC